MATTSRRLRDLPSQVWTLGWVSLATDAGSEAIYPVLPFFLTRVLGAGALSLGIIEGIAEATSSVLRVVSGLASDRTRARKPIVIAGYGLSSAVRPLIAIATAWPQVLAIRFVDRLGKGIRGAPRDALLADVATPGTRGLVYGFHRAMDHAGAIVGPLVAAAILWMAPDRYRLLFGLTIVPGAIAVLLLFRIVEAPAERQGAEKETGQPTSARKLPRAFWSYLAVLAVFCLGNSTDAFLLLRLTDVSGTALAAPLLWSAIHVVKAAVSIVGGGLSDRIDRRRIIVGGWIIYAAVYAGFAVSETTIALVIWFLVYGAYFGFTEGVEKALVADFAPASLRGTAFGIYNGVIGCGALIASVTFGVLWKLFGASIAFGSGAVIALVAAALLLVVVPRPNEAPRAAVL